MGEFFYNLLAIGFAFVSIGFGCLVLCIPFIILAKVAKVSPSTLPQRDRSIKDQVVEAQWEYDRKWNRRK